jgi:hypothetical protein
MVINAARNMKHLTSACLTSNYLSAHIIANLSGYSELSDLKIIGLRPFDHIWTKLPVSLTSLIWESPITWESDPKPLWSTASFLINVVEQTCPQLESLEIRISDPRHLPGELPTGRERARDYESEPGSATPKLTRLRQFGFRFQHQQSVTLWREILR